MPEPCECPARKALELAINTVECASIDLKEGPTKGEALPWYKAARAALSAPCPCEELREQWECFHCGFKTSDPSEAEAHFGERDDAQEFTPTCTWWSRLSADERAQEFQDLRQELNGEREESGQLNITNEGLEHRLLEFENVIDSRFKGARSINDIFHLYDTMEGLKLVAEAERDRLRAELTEALEALRGIIAEADRSTVRFDRAHAVLAKHGEVKA